MTPPLTLATQVHDLRSALDLLEQHPGQLVQTSVEVDPHAELSGVYRYVGAGGTVMRPTKMGPAMVFNKIKGYQSARVAIGLLADRKRVALLLGTTSERLGFHLCAALNNPVAPVMVATAPCQEVVHLASEPGFDILKLIPAPTNTVEDSGPFITMGLCYGADPETGEEDVTIHRLCIQGPDETFHDVRARPAPGRIPHQGRAGRQAPAHLHQHRPGSRGVHRLLLRSPLHAAGLQRSRIAGALRGKPVELAQCLTVDAKAIANAEIVIEGELLPERAGGGGPEQPHRQGHARIPRLQRPGPPAPARHQGQGRHPAREPDHADRRSAPAKSMSTWPASPPKPASSPWSAGPAGPPAQRLRPSLGGGKSLAVLQFKKAGAVHEGRPRQAALLAFSPSRTQTCDPGRRRRDPSTPMTCCGP